MIGWYAVRRGITKHPIFHKKPERLAVWMWLLDNACWKDTQHDIKGKTITVKRGQVCASERHISEECGVGYQVVRTLFKRLQDEHMINAEVTHGKNVITLCNYEKYQNVENNDNALTNAPVTQEQRTKEQDNKSSSLRSEDKTSSAMLDEAVETFNAIAEKSGWPSVRALTDRRKSALKARIADLGGIEGWRELLTKAAASDFLCGRVVRSGEPFKLKFDWITNPTNAAKVAEGNYDNRKPSHSSAPAGFRRVGGEIIPINPPKREATGHENRVGNAPIGADRASVARRGQSSDALPGVQPHEAEEEYQVPFGDGRGGQGSGALPSLRMEFC